MAKKRGWVVQRFVRARKRWEPCWWGQTPLDDDGDLPGVVYNSDGDYTLKAYRHAAKLRPPQSLSWQEARRALALARNHYPNEKDRYRIAEFA